MITITAHTPPPIRYPVARRNSKNDNIVLFVSQGSAVVIANADDSADDSAEDIGHMYAFADINHPVWEPIDVTISG